MGTLLRTLYSIVLFVVVYSECIQQHSRDCLFRIYYMRTVSALLVIYGFTLFIIILRRLNVFSFIWGFNKLLTEYLKPHLCTGRH